MLEIHMSPLCKPCTTVFTADRVARFEYTMDQTFGDMKLAARRGICHLCRLLVKHLQRDMGRYGPGSFPEDARPKLQFFSGKNGFFFRLGTIELVYRICVLLDDCDGDKQMKWDEVPYVNVASDEWRSRFCPTAFDETNDSEKSFHLMHKWLTECHTMHSTCQALRKSQGQRCIPTRLVHFQICGNRFVAPPRVCTTKQELVSDDIRYMTLSHAWGSHTQTLPQLRQDNIEKYFRAIDVGTLPQTFREAMKVATKMCVQYIWIDSLCILQDSDKDWRYEATKMGNYYANAYCNIAAANTNRENGGCFANRSPLDTNRVLITATPVNDCKQTLLCEPEVVLADDIDQVQLLQRGWITQELLLSPGVLLFGDHQCFWQCAQTEANEEFPGGLCDNMSRTHSLTPAKKLMPDLCDSSCPNDSKEMVPNNDLGAVSIKHLWRLIVKPYSRTLLTYPVKDKLIAISSLAQKIGSAADYRAGHWIWSESFLDEICWRAETSTGKPLNLERSLDNGTLWPSVPRPEKYQAPSWSWASVAAGVNWSYTTLNDDATCLPLVDIADVQVDLVDNVYPFGQVISGRLVLDAPLACFQLRLIDIPSLYGSSTNVQGSSWRLDIPEASWSDMLYPDGDPISLDRPLYAIPILHIIDQTSRTNEHVVVKGLLVIPHSKGMGGFTRCGSFQIRSETRSNNKVASFLAMFAQSQLNKSVPVKAYLGTKIPLKRRRDLECKYKDVSKLTIPLHYYRFVIF